MQAVVSVGKISYLFFFDAGFGTIGVDGVDAGLAMINMMSKYMEMR